MEFSRSGGVKKQKKKYGKADVTILEKRESNAFFMFACRYHNGFTGICSACREYLGIHEIQVFKKRTMFASRSCCCAVNDVSFIRPLLKA